MANEASFRDHPGESPLGSQPHAPAASGEIVPYPAARQDRFSGSVSILW
jgi:hypothetical protein